VQLSRLDQASTAAMVDELLEEHIAGTPLERRIFAETEGNPLFILEVAKLASTVGGRLEDLAIPGRVVDVVEHRLDRLTEQERDGLEVAAVEGEYFHVAPIAAVLELTRLKGLKLLQNLERRHRIVRPAEHRFRFDHGKIREVILSRIAPPLRREYHGVVAGCLLEEPAEVASAILAHHLAESGDRVAALPYRRKAGDEARGVFANEEAVHHLGLALATLDAQPTDDAVERQRAEIRLEMAEIHLLTGDFATAAALFQQVAGGVAVAGAERLPARALLGEAECEFALARYDGARQKLDAASHAQKPHQRTRLGSVLILHSERDSLSVRRQRHMAKGQRFHIGGQFVALQNRAGIGIHFQDRAFDVAGVDGRTFDVRRTRDAPDRDDESRAAARKQEIMRFDAGGKQRARRSTVGIAQDHVSRAGFSIDLAGRERASIGTERRMSREAMADEGSEQPHIGVRVTRIEECGEGSGSTADQHDLAPRQLRDGMGAPRQGKTGEAVCSDQCAPVDLADPRCAHEPYFEWNFLRPSTALERDNSPQERHGRAGEETTSIHRPINRHRDC
jgi:hypothetical protein